MNREKTKTPALRLAAALGLCAALLAAPALAQMTSAELVGTVTDASTKAPLHNAVVTATSPNMQGERTLLTDKTGFYRLSQLPPGTYTVRVSKPGYRSVKFPEVALRVNQTGRLNVELPAKQ